jgi:F-type H+-transporting ATPase subunit epsilon
MKLKIYIPSAVFLEAEVLKVMAESPRGHFCLLPRHIDVVTALVPGILSYVTAAEERFVAVDSGILVKKGDEVLVSTRHAAGGTLGELKREVDRMLVDIDEHERKTRSSVARLEADFVRRFVEFGKNR